MEEEGPGAIELPPAPPTRHHGLFAEPAAWSALRQHALEPMLRARSKSAPLRVWVPQCATGDDAYTVAVLVAEVLEDLGVDLEVKIFATETDERALANARAGVFRRADVESLSPARRRHFAVAGDRYRALESTRSAIVFARHDLLADPPFLHLDLIVCRDLLRRADPALRNRMLRTFRHSLVSGGALFLGPADSVGAQRPDLLFEVIDRKYRLFRMVAPQRPDQPRQALLGAPSAFGQPGGTWPEPSPRGRLSHGQILRAALIDRYAPASVLIDHELQVLHFQGATGDFLAPPLGDPTPGLLAMLRGVMVDAVEEAVRAAIEERGPVRVRVANAMLPDDSGGAVMVTAAPLKPSGVAPRFLVVSFELDQEADLTATAAPSRTRVEPGEREHVAERYRVPRAPTLPFDRDVSDRESSSDRLQWAVEELQAANEELESSKEELESINEELHESNERVIRSTPSSKARSGSWRAPPPTSRTCSTEPTWQPYSWIATAVSAGSRRRCAA